MTIPMNGDGAGHPQALVGPHPPGLRTLFVTEMWERFSYYGNRSLLILYMTDTAHGGMGMDVTLAASIYGLFTAAVYLTALPGGWIADRLFGAQRTLVMGAWVIVMGNVCLTLPLRSAFLIGLALIAVGTGLLKPNASAIVGQLYPEGGFRRDAGFTIFYLGINLGAAVGPIACSMLAEQCGWHWGFVPAGVGMICGLIQYRITAHRLGNAGQQPPASDDHQRPLWRQPRVILISSSLALLVGVALAASGVITIDPTLLAQSCTYVIAVIAITVITGIFVAGGLDAGERRRFILIVILMACSVVFWAGFEQAGSSLTLFALDHTERHLVTHGFEIPAGWFLSLNPVFILMLAPLLSGLWMRLGSRGRNPSLLIKVAISLALLAAGFLVMRQAATERLASDHLVSPGWLVGTYLCFTLGELCLSPIGLSAITTLSPRRYAGQMLGVWFLATSLGNLVAGLLAGRLGGGSLAQMPETFVILALAAAILAVILLAVAKPLDRLARGAVGPHAPPTST